MGYFLRPYLINKGILAQLKRRNNQLMSGFLFLNCDPKPYVPIEKQESSVF